MISTLAYGGFRSTTYWGIFDEVFPKFAGIVFEALLIYAAASAIVQYVRIRLVGMLLGWLAYGCMLPTLAVMGQYGPAHVAVETGAWAYVLFAAALLGKCIVLMGNDELRRRAARRLEAAADAVDSSTT